MFVPPFVGRTMSDAEKTARTAERAKRAANTRRVVGTNPSSIPRSGRKGRTKYVVGGGAGVLGAYTYSHMHSSGRNGLQPSASGGTTGIYGM